MVSVSAPGKIHLMGEHAVVYGYPALLTAIDRRVVVSVANASGSDDELDSSLSPAHPFITEGLRIVRDHVGTRFQASPVAVTIQSQVAFGYHLGSSAALAVSLVGALVYHWTKRWNPVEINQVAYEVEKFQHGNPSGGDNTIVTMGGYVWFRKELEFLKSIWQLPMMYPKSFGPLLLCNTGKPHETTGEMVAMVRANYTKDVAGMTTIFRRNECACRDIAQAFKSGDETKFVEALKDGEVTLEQMGVVSAYAKNIVQAIMKSGGVAKILGGGGQQDGVGYMVVYHRQPKKLEAIMKQYQVTFEPVKIGEEGVRLEQRE